MSNTASNLQAQVRATIAEVLGVPVATLTGASSPATIDAWDSVQHLSIVMALEQSVGVQFDPEDIDKMKSVSEIEAIVAAKKS